MRLHFKFAGNFDIWICIVFAQQMVMKTQVAENEWTAQSQYDAMFEPHAHSTKTTIEFIVQLTNAL